MPHLLNEQEQADALKRIAAKAPAGLSDEQFIQYAKTELDKETDAANTFGANVVRSGKEFFGGIGKTLTDPLGTASNVVKLGRGVVVKGVRKGAEAILGEPTDEKGKKLWADLKTMEAPADAVGEFYKQRYGGWDNIKQTLYEDPVGAAADAAGILSAGAGTVARAGSLAKVAGMTKTAGLAGGAAKKLRVLSKVTDPMSLVTEGAKLPARGYVALRKPQLIESAIEDQHSAFKFTPTAKARNPGKDLGKIALEHEVVPTRASMESLGDKVSSVSERRDNIVGSVAGNKRAPRIYEKEVTPALDKTKHDYSRGLFPKTEGAPVAENAAKEFVENWEGNAPISDARWRGTVKREPGFKLRSPGDEVANRVANGMPRPTRDRGISMARGLEATKAGYQTLRKEAANFAKSGNEVPASWDARMNAYSKTSDLIAQKADPLAKKAGLLGDGESLKGMNREIGDMMALETSMKPTVSRLENRDIFSLGAKILMSNAFGRVGDATGWWKPGAMAGMALRDNPVFKSNWGHMKYAAATQGPEAALRRVLPRAIGSNVGPVNEFWNATLPWRSVTTKQRINEAQNPTESDMERAAFLALMKSPGSTERP